MILIVKSQIISFQFLYLKNTSTMVISCQSLNTILLGASVLINSKDILLKIKWIKLKVKSILTLRSIGNCFKDLRCSCMAPSLLKRYLDLIHIIITYAPLPLQYQESITRLYFFKI